ncbi:P27 family phage terminase small subunit [Qipengyuania atrilutea]|uniref:P27 family phage terminase small subunit n=1 Tax=Qipengyuania atrilutea TaxID=2744473 RepID=A0A850H4L9_9SPHN|nr:P27 family phage terminase small subunit [Actirhodobacter atriluteus]NVD44838.1 P27 family phage terminase small subunit [Actirhodobacter atriluteus]
MGRQAKPSAIKKLAGNPGNRPIVSEPEVADLYLVLSANISAAAKPIFVQLSGAMPTGVFKTTDQYLLAAYAEQVAAHEEAVREITKGGAVVMGSQGQPVVSPWVKIRNEAAGKLVTLGARLGLSPVDRSNLKSDDAGQSSNPFLTR